MLLVSPSCDTAIEAVGTLIGEMVKAYLIEDTALIYDIFPPRMLLRRYILGTDNLHMRIHKEQCENLAMAGFCRVSKFE